MTEIPQTLQEWMAYTDGEVRAVCEQRGWGHQVRRRWAAREKPVAESTIEDYEWKLFPGSPGPHQPMADSGDCDEGVYYVLGFSTVDHCWLFQHDTHHAGNFGRHRSMSTFTRIQVDGVLGMTSQLVDERNQLRDYLVDLVDRFGPNTFSLT
jgi:hypothetical protein